MTDTRQLHVTLDGHTVYSGPVPTWTLPPQPELWPDTIRDTNPPAPPTALARLFALTATIELFTRLLQSERIGATVNTTTTGPGHATITIDMGMDT